MKTLLEPPRGTNRKDRRSHVKRSFFVEGATSYLADFLVDYTNLTSCLPPMQQSIC